MSSNLPTQVQADHRTASSFSGKRVSVAAPARVNLIGEHTDYTGGYVLPMAVPFETSATITARDDARYCFTSDQFEDAWSFEHGAPASAQGNWSDYPTGVLHELTGQGISFKGFDLHLQSNIPLGAGLSSSASVEVASALAMMELAGKSLSAKEVALLCQRAENHFVSSPCGVMDQFAVTLAKANHALLLHTGMLQYEAIPMNVGKMDECCVVICNSMVRHSIATGDYGLRRREVEAGQALLRAEFPVPDLGEATLAQLEACAAKMSHESFLRCRHILNENARVLQAKEAMLAGDPVKLGELMMAAHASQRDDFACSCAEIDFLVETAHSFEGCHGARMTGGGFGGCTVNLVERNKASEFATTLKHRYQKAFGVAAMTYECEAVDGAWWRGPFSGRNSVAD